MVFLLDRCYRFNHRIVRDSELRQHLTIQIGSLFEVPSASGAAVKQLPSFTIRSLAWFRFPSIEFWNLIDLSVFVLTYVLSLVKQFLASCASFIVLSMWIMGCWKLVVCSVFEYQTGTKRISAVSTNGI